MTQQKIKIKKIIDKTKELRECIKQADTKTVKPKKPKYVLPLTDHLYITCDKHGWIICKDGKPTLYASTLDQILMAAAHYMIKIPADYDKLVRHIQDIENLISARIPANFRPKDLFKEVDSNE